MSDTMEAPALRTALYDAHLALNAKMVPFAGYGMPVQYSGIIAESNAVRQSAGMFDVSHMARLWLKGDRVVEFLEQITTNDISKLTDGRGQYSLLPNRSGGLVDDIIVYRITETVFRMVVNAANHEKDVNWIKAENERGGYGVEITDETDDTAMIAVQGPKAAEIIAGLSDAAEALNAAPMFGIVECNIAGVPCFAPRSGYTGEDGFELVCPASGAVQLWDALVAAGVAACGLGSRDVLRVEAGLPLYGHELGDDMSPISAGLGWVISKVKSFNSSEAFNKDRAEGTPTKLLGVKLESKRLTMPGMKVYQNGQEIGELSSGVYSPLLECGIAFAFLKADTELDTPCEVDVRGKMEPGTVVNKRFFKRGK